MKRLSSIIVIVVLFALLSVVPAMAKSGKAPVKGEVIAIDLDNVTVTLQTSNAVEPVVVHLPESVDILAITVGDILVVKGVAQEDGSILAERVMWAETEDEGEGEPGEDDGEEDGGKLTSAYCEAGQKETAHPFATRLAVRFGVEETWVMDHFCGGMGMGAIMLALMTNQKTGTSPDELLEARGGQGWGQIWKAMGLIGAEKDGESPPGHLKRPEHAGPKNGKDN